jgi:hypothetical protein
MILFAFLLKLAAKMSVREYAINKPLILDILSGTSLLSGFEISHSLEKLRGEVIGFGTIYLSLDRLVEEGLIERMVSKTVNEKGNHSYRYRSLVISPTMFLNLPRETRESLIDVHSLSAKSAIAEYYKILNKSLFMDIWVDHKYYHRHTECSRRINTLFPAIHLTQTEGSFNPVTINGKRYRPCSCMYAYGCTKPYLTTHDFSKK